MQRFLVTGGAGFIGSALVRLLLTKGHAVSVLDAFTYAGVRENFADLSSPRLTIHHADLRRIEDVRKILRSEGFDGVFHLAAESHVDNSILGPKVFFETNVLGTLNLLEACRESLPRMPKGFRIVHVSTDEVFGALGKTGKFKETTAYDPRSPYSASKAASDHVASAWAHTYNLPIITTNCSNNYGPRQYPEKLIPRMIVNALSEKPLPVYGTGKNVRDWIHVDDHCHGLWLAYQRGRIGETYLFGGRSERHNLEVVKHICASLDELRPRAGGQPYNKLIQMVPDRPGHDFRYAINDSKAVKELGFKRQHKSFESGLRKTVTWYLNNSSWLAAIDQRLKVA